MSGEAKPRLPAARRRELIEAAAARLFAERGYAGTTLADVAAAAGVSKPIVYRHFRDKKMLHMALLGAHRDGLLEVLAASAAGAGPLEGRLRVILDAWFGYVQEHPYAWRMLFRDTTGDPEIQAFHRELQASARDVTARLIEADPEVAIPPSEVQALAELVRASMTGLALWWLDHPEVARDAVVDVAWRFLSEGLGAGARDSEED